MTTASTDVDQRISSIIGSDRVVLFMKGNREAPQCGFSAQVVQILDRLLPDYTTVDVLSDLEIREGIKSYSDWPTIPQLYIGGEFQGGCDIVREMYQSGELRQALGIEESSAEPPEISISEGAREILDGARAQYGDQELHLSIDARYRHSLGFGPKSGDEVEVEAGGVRILLDPDSASRAKGLSIDVDEASGGARLRIDNPGQPAPTTAAGGASGDVEAQVRAITPDELESLRAEASEHRLIDVRTPEEREIARIEGSELLDAELARELQSLPRDTQLVFHCHHGGRAQGAAEQFAAAGFTRVFNLAGGIDAWSLEVDPEVPRY